MHQTTGKRGRDGTRESRIYIWTCSGIDVVRNRIKAFATKKVTLPPGKHKIIILDEADR